MKTLFFLLVTTAPLQTILSFVVLPSLQPQRLSNRPLFSSTSEEAERLRESASKLRREADALREKLGPPSTVQQWQQAAKEAPVVVYTTLMDSSWELSYRFSKDPSPSDNPQSQESTTRKYSGKLTVTLKSDGYTDLISHVPSGSRDTLDIQKVWGWDEEEQDDLRYLLFSISADSDCRFYWQARIHVGTNGIISLEDGTISVKRNAVPGFWGVFDGSGILAQFYNVGNFGAKPVRVTKDSESKLL